MLRLLRPPLAASFLPKTCVALFAAVALTGCLGSRLEPEARTGVRIAGVWKLNRAASEDPQKIITALRTRSRKENPPGHECGPCAYVWRWRWAGSRWTRRRRGGGRCFPEPDEYDATRSAARFGPDPLRNSPTMHALRDVLQRGDYLTIRQSPEQVSFDYGNY